MKNALRSKKGWRKKQSLTGKVKTMRFLDTNILLRYFTGDNLEMAESARRLLAIIQRGEEKVVTSPLVVFETVFTLQRTYGVSRERIGSMVGAIISLPGIRFAEKRLCLEALDVFVQHRISFADAYTVVHMKARGITEIYSWDSDFDKIEDVRRVVPT